MQQVDGQAVFWVANQVRNDQTLNFFSKLEKKTLPVSLIMNATMVYRLPPFFFFFQYSSAHLISS
jgi:hypothetical protein